ncbi:MAG: copper amine oxidase N-terminal domain-containing protein [Defluviitaleaceae bacterium]|nr:copper amine oxidase N-terminal domain-containing protein [Defluviitaleaceae bacterium]
MGRKLIIFLLLSAVLLLVACGHKFEDEAFNEYIPNHTTIQATDEVQITIAYVTDELLSHFESFVMFYPDVDSQTGDGVAFIPSVPVLNFRYIKINGAEVMFIVEEDLLVLDILLPETPLLVDWVATGSMAYGGFAFDDENGTTRYFAFNYDAEGLTAFRWMEFDGSLSLYDELQEATMPSATIVVQLTLDTELILESSSYANGEGELIFTATTDLHEFELFTVGIVSVSDRWIENEWQPFYVNELLGYQDVLYRGAPIVVPWQLSSHFGIGFLDEYGIRRNFIISFDDVGGRGFPHLFSDFFFPLFINEFTDRGQEVDSTNNSNKTVMQSNENINVIVDGAEVIFDGPQPMIVDGQIMIPIEAVFEQLGAKVELYTVGADYRVLIRGIAEMSFSIGEEAVNIHPQWHISNPPPQMINGHVMLPVDIVVTAISERGHFAIWDEEQLVLSIFSLDSEENKHRVMSEAANWYRERGINAVMLEEIEIVDSHMLFARPSLGFGIFYIMVNDDEFITVNSELDGDQATYGIFVPGRERTRFVTWRHERGPGSPIEARTFIQIFEDEEALLREMFPNVPNPPLHSSNPFAAAILEYNAGGVDATQYNEIWGRDWLGPSTKAITVNIDDGGTQGVLAWRVIAPDGSPVPDFRLFALHNGVISYLDVGGLYAFEMHVTQEGRVVEVMSHPMAKTTYTLFGIENGILVRLQPLYNLDNTVFWTDFEDETESILK